ncbi:MAG TPA: PEP-utilizing enzyme [Candidatus Norongarragalinales archaeon]|nr:PEP-utilizing enzyme [Candidatus Norongarragalinales archaeon]
MVDFSQFKGRKNYVQATESVIQLIWIPGVATGRLLRDRLGIGYDSIIGIFRNDFTQWLYDEADLKKLTEFVMEKQGKDGSYIEGLIRLWKRTDLRKFEVECKRLDGVKFGEIPDEKLLQLYNEYVAAYYAEWAIPIVADAISLHSESLARHELIRLLKSLGRQKEFSGHFPILTAPIGMSFANEERMDLLKILGKAQKMPIGREMCKKGKVERIKQRDLEIRLLRKPIIFSLLKIHAQKYHWIRNSYLMARNLGPADFASELAELLIEGRDAEVEMGKTRKSLKIAKSEKAKAIRILGVAGKLALVLGIIEKFASWQDERKKYNLIGDHYLYNFLVEIAKRMGVGYYDVAYSTPEELAEWFGRGKIDVKLLRTRRKFGAMIVSTCITGVYCGKDAAKLEKILKLEKGSSVSDVRGQCASIGRVEGFVKIVNNSREMDKMRKGDILVSSMTRPELVPAMKKAAAIVTDEGGITSHAAIVSRELGIPCIIGTKVATKVFKDGDFVEVNANHGVIRKVEK